MCENQYSTVLRLAWLFLAGKSTQWESLICSTYFGKMVEQIKHCQIHETRPKTSYQSQVLGQILKAKFNHLAVNHDVMGMMLRFFCWGKFILDLP